jgi:hypothetical protein
MSSEFETVEIEIFEICERGTRSCRSERVPEPYLCGSVRPFGLIACLSEWSEMTRLARRSIVGRTDLRVCECGRIYRSVVCADCSDEDARDEAADRAMETRRERC